jgi:cytochrome c peroxidase
MKKIIVAFFCVSIAGFFGFSSEDSTLDTDTVQKKYCRDVIALREKADSLLLLASDSNCSLVNLRAYYHVCRDQYKYTEIFTEYFYPNTAKLLNGPLIPEADEEEGTQTVFQPEGLQVVEEIIYSDSLNKDDRLDLFRAVWRFAAACRRLEQLSAKQKMLDWQIMDALRQEVIRVLALGITGFDTPSSNMAIQDNVKAIDGIESVTVLILPSIETQNRQLSKKLKSTIRDTKAYLSKNTDFVSFNRMVFIRDYANPLYSVLTDACETLAVKWPQIPSVIDKKAKTIFEKDAFNPWYYARDNRTQLQSQEVASLGQILFFDPILSGDQQRACASCHRPDKGFTDGNATSIAFTGSGSLKRNSPSILNAALQATYFYDVRVNFLEDQIRQVVNNKDELHGDFTSAINLIRTSEEYKTLFIKAFSGTRDTAVTTGAIVAAISAYERTLISMDSRFDKHIRNEGNYLTKEEIDGFNLFTGKALCATCHFLPLFNGTVPPLYSKSETEILGVPLKNDTTNTEVDSDIGRLHTSGMLLHKFAFKTSSVRNVALTAPYMHNGVYYSLLEVIEFYNRGGALGSGEDLPTQTLPADRLNLTEREKDNLVRFLESLTDTVGLTSKPSRLPILSDSNLNNRKIGGNY